MNRVLGFQANKDRRLLQFSDKLRNCATLEEGWTELTSFAALLGYEKGAYIVVPKQDGHVHDKQPVCFSNHDKDWIEYYYNHQYYFKDPAMKHILQGNRSDQLWTDYTLQRPEDVDSDFFEDVQDAGLRFGLNMPLECSNRHLVGGASFKSVESNQRIFESQIAANVGLLRSATQVFHAYAQSAEHLHQFFGLSPREKECLLWLTAGRANKEIAHMLDLSEKTVEHHIKRACQKLMVTNRTHAVARAMTFELLSH